MPSVRKRVREDGTRYTALYRDPSGRQRSAGTFASQRAAERAGRRAEGKVDEGAWLDRSAGRITFRKYVEEVWWPSRHLEVTTKAGYRYYLDRHFLPSFGDLAMADILPSTVQAWVTQASEGGLSPRSIVKYHVMLHSVFKRAVRDRVIGFNPCSDTELPKVVARKTRILTLDEFEHLLSCVPDRWVAQWKADLVAQRPKTAKLVANEPLRQYVQDRLSGVVRRPDGSAVVGPLTRPREGRGQAAPSRPPLGDGVEPGADLSSAHRRLPR